MSLVLPKNPNIFANSPLDRAGHLRTDQDWLKAAWADRKSAFIPVWKLMPFLIRNREGRRMIAQLQQRLPLSPVARHRLTAAQDLPHRVPRQPALPRDLLDPLALNLMVPTDPTYRLHHQHPR